MIYLPIPVMMSEALTQLGFVFLDKQSWINNCFWFTIDLLFYSFYFTTFAIHDKKHKLSHKLTTEISPMIWFAPPPSPIVHGNANMVLIVVHFLLNKIFISDFVEIVQLK